MYYLNGTYVSKNDAKIPITDRGFLFGDGAYATIQVREGMPLFLETHLKRLHVQCHSFGLEMPQIHPQNVFDLIELNGADEGIWRLKILVTGGDDPEYRLKEGRMGRLLMMLTPYEVLPLKPLKMGIFPIPFSLCHAHFKSLAHLNRLYVMEEANKQGLDDCITLTDHNHVLEASFGNLCWVTKDTFFTPSRALPLYFGVTIEKAIEVAQELGFKVREVKTSLYELPNDASYFRTNTMGGIRPIIQMGSLQLSYDISIHEKFCNSYLNKIAEQKQIKPVKL